MSLIVEHSPSHCYTHTWLFVQSVLKGTVRFTNATIVAKYRAQFPQTGAANSLDRSGEVTERLATVFADVELELSNLVPQRILSFSVRDGADFLDELTNMEDTNMANINIQAFRKGLRQVVDNIISKNIKVQINKAVQAMKTEAAA